MSLSEKKTSSFSLNELLFGFGNVVQIGSKDFGAFDVVTYIFFKKKMILIK